MIIIFLFASNLYFKYKQCLQKVLKKMRTKEMHDTMEVMMKVLMSKIDEMINRQGVPKVKEKKF